MSDKCIYCGEVPDNEFQCQSCDSYFSSSPNQIKYMDVNAYYPQDSPYLILPCCESRVANDYGCLMSLQSDCPDIYSNYI